MTDTEVATTGLSIDDGTARGERPPNLCSGAAKNPKLLIRGALLAHGLRLLKGGRFYHAMGDADKASAVAELLSSTLGLNEAPW